MHIHKSGDLVCCYFIIVYNLKMYLNVSIFENLLCIIYLFWIKKIYFIGFPFGSKGINSLDLDSILDEVFLSMLYVGLQYFSLQILSTIPSLVKDIPSCAINSSSGSIGRYSMSSGAPILRVIVFFFVIIIFCIFCSDNMILVFNKLFRNNLVVKLCTNHQNI